MAAARAEHGRLPPARAPAGGHDGDDDEEHDWLPPTTIQPRLVGVSFPPPGAAKKRKPESPKAMAEAPIHSRTVMVKRK